MIDAQRLTKRYGEKTAVDGLDFVVKPGTVTGFLGPNGAGKSTTIRILLGLARASGGTARLLDADPWHDAAALHRRIAYVPGDVSVWPNLSGGEAVDLLVRLRGVDPRSTTYRTQRERLFSAFQFDPRTAGRAYSKGNRQKISLIAAFALPAELYILDEPTSGLDPLMEIVFQQEVARVSAAGATVLLSSHILSEVERHCDHVSIIRAGRIVESGTLTELRHLTRTEVSFDDEGTVPAGAQDVVTESGRIRFTVDPAEMPATLATLAAAQVQGLRVNPPSLEELFLRHYGDDAQTRRGSAA